MKKNKGVVLVLKSGDSELLSFNVSDFKDLNEVNIVLNYMVRVLSGLIISATFIALSTKSDKGEVNMVIDVARHLMDVLSNNTKDEVSNTLKEFVKKDKTKDTSFGGNA